MNYTVAPGLYAVGSPGRDSEVLVSANYRLSFDLLRRELKGIDAWILVLDTRGINVWCAAGKGTFGTDELVSRVESSGIAGVVSHRRLIVPQLGASGVNAYEVEKKTGFRVYFGPVRAADIPEYLKNGRKKTALMSAVTFTFTERLELTPLELFPALRFFVPAALATMVLMGIERNGIMFGSVAAYGLPVAAIMLAGVISGALLTPLLLPLLPVRSFALKGLIAGVMLAAVLQQAFGFINKGGWTIAAFAWTFLPLVSSYLSLQFTGATVFTGMSGVKKEIRYGMPLFIAGAVLAVVLVVVHKLYLWGIA